MKGAGAVNDEPPRRKVREGRMVGGAVKRTNPPLLKLGRTGRGDAEVAERIAGEEMGEVRNGGRRGIRRKRWVRSAAVVGLPSVARRAEGLGDGGACWLGLGELCRVVDATGVLPRSRLLALSGSRLHAVRVSDGLGGVEWRCGAVRCFGGPAAL